MAQKVGMGMGNSPPSCWGGPSVRVLCCPPRYGVTIVSPLVPPPGIDEASESSEESEEEKAAEEKEEEEEEKKAPTPQEKKKKKGEPLPPPPPSIFGVKPAGNRTNGVTHTHRQQR